jgi:hypothetical protein
MKTKISLALAAMATVVGIFSVSQQAVAATYSYTSCEAGMCTDFRCDDFGCVIVRKYRDFRIEN